VVVLTTQKDDQSDKLTSMLVTQNFRQIMMEIT